jgi:hypothetical protein
MFANGFFRLTFLRFFLYDFCEARHYLDRSRASWILVLLFQSFDRHGPVSRLGELSRLFGTFLALLLS